MSQRCSSTFAHKNVSKIFDYLVATHILVAVTHVMEKGHQYFCFDFAANFSSRYQHWYKTIYLVV